MDSQQRFLKRCFLIFLPLFGGFILGGLVLDRRSSNSSGQFSQETASMPANPSSLPDKMPPIPLKSPSLVPVSPPPQTGQSSLLPTVKVTPSQASKLQPIDPKALTAEQKALNQQAKASFFAGTPTADTLLEMRVAIAEGVSSLQVGADKGAEVVDAQGRTLHQLALGARYTIQSGNQSILLEGKTLPTIVWVLPAPNSTFRLEDRQYRGKLLLVADRGNLWAVNHVSLRQYLSSVVASEVSASWPIEALKAQAVAARSYALTYYLKPVNSFYQLGATEYYQVYSGIEREAERTSQAVDSTAGEFVSHRGGVVESLYAASDDIVAEAFSGQGMSQLGALELAKQGYGYQQILSHYYPDTGVGRVAADMN